MDKFEIELNDAWYQSDEPSWKKFLDDQWFTYQESIDERKIELWENSQ